MAEVGEASSSGTGARRFPAHMCGEGEGVPHPERLYSEQICYMHRSTVISNLGVEAFRIPGEQTCSSNVVQF